MPTETWLFARDVFPVWYLKLILGIAPLTWHFLLEIKALYDLCLVQRTTSHRRLPEVSTKGSLNLNLEIPDACGSPAVGEIFQSITCCCFLCYDNFEFSCLYSSKFFSRLKRCSVSGPTRTYPFSQSVFPRKKFCDQWTAWRKICDSRSWTLWWLEIHTEAKLSLTQSLWYIMTQLVLMQSASFSSSPVDSPVTDSAATRVSRRNGKKQKESSKSSSSNHEGRAKTAKSVSYQ